MPVRPRARARSLVRALVAVLLVVGAGTALAGPAAAHVSLTGTTPAAGAQVDPAPMQVELTYSAALLEVGNAVQVTGPSGPLTLEPPQVADRSLVQPLPADLPPGEYTVLWRAASGDGHPIEGSFAFTSAGTAPSSSGPAPTASTAPSTSTAPGTSTALTTTSEQAASATSGPTTSGDAAGATDSTDSSLLALWTGLPVALLGAVGVAAIALRHRRRPGEHE